MTLKIEIWSDIVCPFCYIGKRSLDLALESFPKRDQVELHWKSFELDPHAPKKITETAHERLAKKYGKSLDWAKKATARTTAMAKEVGLTMNYDCVIPANTFDAHRLAHLAARQGLQAPAEERLMKAYFTDGLNINDAAVLQTLGVDIGLAAAEVKELLSSQKFSDEVRRDEEDAQRIGVQAVPFFLFNGEFALRGAQPAEVFRQALGGLA